MRDINGAYDPALWDEVDYDPARYVEQLRGSGELEQPHVQYVSLPLLEPADTRLPGMSAGEWAPDTVTSVPPPEP